MTESFWMEVLKQGGFAILAGVMFFVYRQDASRWAAKSAETAQTYAAGQAASAQAYAHKQAESAQAFMAFGSETATSLTQVAETMRGMMGVLARIDERLASSQLRLV